MIAGLLLLMSSFLIYNNDGPTYTVRMLPERTYFS